LADSAEHGADAGRFIESHSSKVCERIVIGQQALEPLGGLFGREITGHRVVAQELENGRLVGAQAPPAGRPTDSHGPFPRPRSRPSGRRGELGPRGVLRGKSERIRSREAGRMNRRPEQTGKHVALSRAALAERGWVRPVVRALMHSPELVLAGQT